MILGYEQPVDIPVMSIYDKDMAKMYINALREDYKDAIAKTDQFMKEYGDFIGASDADTQYYYENTIGGLDKLMSDPNLIRSQEGRGMIEQYIRSRPYGNLAKIKATARNVELFNQAKRQMIQNGTYNDEMARMLGEDPSNWNTISNGVFDKVSPTAYRSMEDMLLPTIQQLQKSYKFDPVASKGGYEVYRVSPEQVDAAINRVYGDILTNPSMKFHFDTYRNQNPSLSYSEAMENFKNLIRDQIQFQTPEKRETDQTALAIMKMQNDNREKAKDRKLQMLLSGGSGSSSSSNGGSSMTMPYTDRIQFDQQSKFISSGRVGAIIGGRQIDTASLAQYWYNKANNPRVSQRDKKIMMGFVNIWNKFPYMNHNQQMNILKQYKLVDSKGNFTKKFINYQKQASLPTRGKSIMNHAEQVRNANNIYQSDMAVISDPQIIQKYSQMASDGRRTASGKYSTTSFGSGLVYTPSHILRQTGAVSNSTTSKRWAETNFGDWLNRNRISGNIFSLSNASHGFKWGSNGKKFEVSGYSITVPFSKIKSWLQYAKQKNLSMPHGSVTKGKSDEEILAGMGLSIVDQNGGTISTSVKNKSTKSTTTTRKQLQEAYVVIPSTFVTDANMANMSGMNEWYDKQNYGPTNNYKESINSINAAVQTGK